jgi:hypothetical protein
MNLIKIAEQLKDDPLSILKGYVDGANPEVPAWLAVAELNRRQEMQKRAADQAKLQEAQAQPNQPSVKETLEQQSGLATLEAQQKQQADQKNLEEVTKPGGPTPPGIPQPEPQPQQEDQQGIEQALPQQPEAPPEMITGAPQETQMMASGGMTASDGIEALSIPEDMYDFEGYADGGILKFGGASGSSVPVVTDPDEAMRSRIRNRRLVANPYNRDTDTGVTQENAEPPASAPTKPVSGIEALNSNDFVDRVKLGMETYTPEENVERIKMARKAAGVTGKYGEEQQKRYDEEDAQYKDMVAKDRAFNRFIGVMAGIGQGGIAGAAPAYLQSKAAEEQADIGHKRRMNELRGNIENKQREEGTGIANKAFENSETSKNTGTQAASQMASAQIHALSNLEVEARRSKNELDRLEQQGAQGLELENARFKHQESIHALDRASAAALAKFNAEAPTAEQKNLKNYSDKFLAANPGKTELDAFRDYFKETKPMQINAAGRQTIAETKALTENSNYNRTVKNLAAEESKASKDQDPAKIARLKKQLELIIEQHEKIYPGSRDKIPNAPPPNAVRLKQ